ncbi:cell division protein FtsZ [Methylibium sp.]|uniref:cell division protein FtsZ n=1 Tax=Methylibium sp. TaxID=2067992 RepID=UPI003D151AC7
MSTLQLSLAILGGLVLAAVVAHGTWQARRNEVKRVPQEPLAAALQEPTFAPETTVQTEEPVVAEDEDSAPPRLEPTLVRRAGVPRLDALIDAIATLTVDSPVSGETAIAHLPPARRAGSKPLLVEGLNAETGEWEMPAPGQRYGEFQAGVQLANRSGALNEIEYSEFVQKVQAFAEPLGALPDFPDMLDVVARARELDAFAGQHDAQLALRLVSRAAAWSLGYVQQHAARHGFMVGVLPGRLVLASAEDAAPPVLTLQFDPQAALADEPSQAAVRELTLSFDVPQTAADAAPFEAWCAAGQALSAELDAAMYDDGGQPLQPAAFASIGQALETLYAALAERDLAAGSPAARRLFS